MSVTRGRLLALVVFAANIAVAVFVFTNITQSPGTPAELAALAALAALPGFLIVWFHEALAETGFARGVLHPSPAFLVAIIGWLLLALYPLWFVCRGSGGLLPLRS